MAGKKENIKALFTNTRSRVIIIFTLVMLLIAVVLGALKFSSALKTSTISSADLGHTPGGIQSVPGSSDQTAQYASLQETQNIQQAQQAAKTGNSAIPTIIRTQAFGEGIEAVGPQKGEGAVGFETLAREDSGGAQQSLWLQSLKDSNCSKSSVNSVVNQGAGISDLKAGCSCMQLKDNGYKFTDLEGVCPCKELKAAGFNARQMKDAGVSASQLRQCGFDACELRGAGFTAQQMKDGGYSDGELKGAGFSDKDIAIAGGLPEGITAAEVRQAGCDSAALSRLRVAGVSAAAIRRISGCSAAQLKAAGFSAQDLQAAGFSAADLLNAGFTPEQLKDAGYSARDLLNAGVSSADLAAAGFTPDDIKAAEAVLPPGMTSDDIKVAGCNVDTLKRERLAGVSASLIRQYAGCSAESLKAAGFTNDDLANAGFTPAQIGAVTAVVGDDAIKAAGCDPTELNKLFLQGVSAERIHDLNGCSAQALKNAGFDAQQVAAAGFTPEQLLAAGFSPAEVAAASAPPVADAEITAAGCDPQKLHALFMQGVSAERIHDLNGCSAAALKAAGYDAKELTAAGFTPQQLVAAGFTAAEVAAAQSVGEAAIRAAGCDPQKLHALMVQGVSAKRIHALNGCSAQALKNAGFDAQQVAAAGFTPEQLLAAGYTGAEVAAAVQPVANEAIKAAGCDPQKLHALFMQGVSAKRIHDLNGCSAEALKNAGFDAKALIAAGFTPQQLLAAGYNAAEVAAAQPVADAVITAAGCDPVKLHALFLQGESAKRIHDLNGCSAEALKNAGFNAKELADAGFTPEQLLAAGFTPQQLRVAGLSPAGVIAVGRTANCSVASLKAAHALGISAITIKQTLGCSAKAMKDAGYTASELKDAGFTAAELKAAGFSAEDLKNAGFSAKELRAAGFSAQQLKDAGFNAEQLKNAGFSATDLKNAGFSAEQLKAAGYSAAALKEAGFSVDALRKAGYSAKDLKDTGFGAGQLSNAGFSAQSLQDAGFLPNDSSLAGLQGTPQQAGPPMVTSLPSFPGSVKDGNAAVTGASNSKQLQDIMKRQQNMMADQHYQQKIQQRTSVMLGAANEALHEWKAVPAQAYVGGSAGGKDAHGVVAGEGQVGQPGIGNATTSAKALIKAGDVLFAVLDTSVNTDEPGPILATIVSGKLNGAKLIGSFTLPSNANKMVISFHSMSVPGAAKTTSITAYAIDPNTARTALASKTNHHYLLRYGSLFASTFIEGIGNAFQSANTTITIGGVGGATNTTISNGASRSILENAVIGLATLGKSWGQVAMQQFSTPTTVDLYAGTGVGVLFTQDLASL